MINYETRRSSQTFFQSDIEAQTLHRQIQAKITHDLNATKELGGKIKNMNKMNFVM